MLKLLEIKALKPRATKYEHMDPGSPGFGISVLPNGKKTYIYRYRVGGRGGKLRRLSLGAVEGQTLTDVRKAYRDAKDQLASGIDPLEAKAETKRQKNQELTFQDLAEKYLAQHAAHKRTGAEDARILEHDVLPRWKELKAKSIRKRDVVELLDSIRERGASTQANRTFACVRMVFNWALQKDLVETNPCAGVKAPSKEKQKDRVLSDEEIRRLWTLPRLSPSVLAGLRLQLLLAQRIGEIVGMRWDELDLQAGLWTLPAERAKNETVHTVPLTSPALDILAEQRQLADAQAVFVFPASTDPIKHLRVDSVGTALTRAITAAEMEHFTAHDLRRTAATQISGLGTSREVLRQILNHVDRSVTARYDRYRYDNEKREALDKWAAQLAAIFEAG